VNAADTKVEDTKVLEELRGERDMLLRSLEDLDREHDAGDLSDKDYEMLRDRYTARAASVLRALEENASNSNQKHPEKGALGDHRTEEAHNEDGLSDDSAEGARSPDDTESDLQKRSKLLRVRRRWRVAIVCALVVVIALSVGLVVHGASSRLPGETETGSVRLSPQQQLQRTLAQAETLESEGNSAQALKLYEQVLKQSPDQELALSESGWLEFEAGVDARNASLLSKGQEAEEKAETVDPNGFGPHLYLGSMYLVEGQKTMAVDEYKKFLADNPPASVVEDASTYIDRAFEESGLPAPTLPAGG
jgi:tetratricopeptide (TPR) repeat protein